MARPGGAGRAEFDGMNPDPIPIVILGGSDSRPVELPENGRDKHPLIGFKGVDVRIGGRPLIAELVDRLRASGVFSSIYIAGPRRVYRPLELPVEVVDTDGSFGENIRAAVEAVGADHPGRPVAFVTCDVVPEVETLRILMVAWAEAAPVDLWFPLIRAPENRTRLGESAWKPRYRIVPGKGEEPVAVLPGHLVVADPAALRLPFMYRLLGLGYRTRNRPIRLRRTVMLRDVVLVLLWQDLLHLVSFRLPNLTWTVLRAGLTAAEELRRGRVTRRRMEDALRKMFVKYRHRRRHPERGVRLPIVDAMSLAKDIDTVEEAREIGAEVRSDGAG